MKHLNLSLLAILMMTFLYSHAQTIVGSKHDFSTASWNNSVGHQICIVCHTPHNANTLITDAPLWNHATSAVTNYNLYTSSTLTATMNQPDASSKLCLSCHDGTVAIENFGTITNGSTYITGTPLIGSDLKNDHPVSFTYDATLASADGHLFNPASTASGLGGTINDKMLFSGKLQCASCHDVHNSAGVARLLKKENASSALCLTCRNK